MPSNHNKPDDAKPWDRDDIDKWKIDPFSEKDSSGAFLEETSFVTLFPRYREKYLKETWPLITQALKKIRIACQLDLIEGSMTVKTTLKTFDPASILKARDLIKLLSRSVPAPQALRILEDGMAMDIIKIRNLVRNNERFQKRRESWDRMYVLTTVRTMFGDPILNRAGKHTGGTVAVMGGYKSLKEVRRIVEDTMNNVHPIYLIKELMIKRELQKDSTLHNENWERYLPNFKKRNVQRRKPQKINDKKPYTPFPPAPEKSKVDKQIESGEYFLGKQAKQRAIEAERAQKAKQKMDEKKQKREREFVPPAESTARPFKKSRMMDGYKQKIDDYSRDYKWKMDDYKRDYEEKKESILAGLRARPIKKSKKEGRDSHK